MAENFTYIPIRTELLLAAIKDRKLIRPLAMSIVFKSKVSSGTARSINHIHEVTGISAEAVKKYRAKLEEYGLSFLTGKRNLTVFGRIRSTNNKKNYEAKITDISSTKEVEKSLRSMLLVVLQAQKEYVRRTTLALSNPHSLKEYKEAKSSLRRFRGYLVHGFKDYGISYKCIAKKLGTSIVTAVKDVKNAVENLFLIKTRNYYQVFCKSARSLGSFLCEKTQSWLSPTFTTKNNIYYIKANTYKIHNSIPVKLALI